jgi:hypothetical protein
MGGPGSGHGIKRPDHPGGELLLGKDRAFLKTQKKHLKSVFSDLPDPSCHAHKLARDRAKGNKDYEMSAPLRKMIGLEYKEMQEIARQNADEAMQVYLDIMRDPDSAGSVKLAAADRIMERAFGKTAQMNLNVNATLDGNPMDLSDADLTREIKAIVGKVKTIESGGSQTEEVESEVRPKNLREYN